MEKTRKCLVTRDLVGLLECAAEAVMDKTPGLREQWQDENRTSAVTRKKGGLIKLDSDNDWSVAFFVWYVARGQDDKLPREGH